MPHAPGPELWVEPFPSTPWTLQVKPFGLTPALRAAYDDLRRRLQDG